MTLPRTELTKKLAGGKGVFNAARIYKPGHCSEKKRYFMATSVTNAEVEIISTLTNSFYLDIAISLFVLLKSF